VPDGTGMPPASGSSRLYVSICAPLCDTDHTRARMGQSGSP
jgi:hypothetical protein